jgi:hypothetical protein
VVRIFIHLKSMSTYTGVAMNATDNVRAVMRKFFIAQNVYFSRVVNAVLLIWICATNILIGRVNRIYLLLCISTAR